MPRILKAILLVAVSLCLATPVLAEAREERETIEPANGGPAFDHSERFAPLGVGAPAGLAMLDAWVTANDPDPCSGGDFRTDKSWCYITPLFVQGCFITPKEKQVTVTLDVKRVDGTIEFHADPYTDTPSTSQVNCYMVDVGRISSGFFKVVYKVKQGTAVVGQSFWIQVQACTLTGTEP